jgi:hypothetical protein
MDNKNKTIAEKIFKAIKKALADARKYNKENNFPINSWNRRSQQVDISVWDDTTWNGNKKVINHYSIRLGEKEVAKCKTHYDVSEVFSELRKMLNEQKKVKGWGGLNYTNDKITFNVGMWSDYSVRFIPKVCLAETACKEFNSLQNYINKYGVGKYGCKVNLNNYELFSAAMGGKRGRLWDEYGERVFLDNKPKKCARLLEELRKARGTKDVMFCERGEEDYIDPEEQRYSAYAEIECEGEKRKYLHITIKTPSGKVKYDEKIY